MSPNYPRDRRPANVRHLQRVVSEAAKAEKTPEPRIHRWISAMALLGALQRANADRDDPERGMLLKGGVAMEVRLGLTARATKDIDLVFHGTLEALLDDLDAAFVESYSGFSFERSVPEPIRNTGSYGLRVKLYYGERRESWQTLQVEAAPAELEPAEIEHVRAISISDFGLEGPAQIPCLSLRYQIAQKLHACTERFDDDENDRSRDLIDLILLRDLAENLPAVREACVKTFERRGKHAWPPELTIEPSWPDTYRGEAAKYGFEVEEVGEAAATVRAFIVEIDAMM